MNSAGRNWARICLLVGSLLLLAGCRVTGTAEIDSQAKLRVDLMVTQDGAETGCEDDVEYWAGLGLVLKPETLPDGAPACHVTGSPTSEFMRASLAEVGTQGKYVVLDLGATSPTSWLPAGDVVFTLPGPVELATFGEVSDNRVRMAWDKDTGNPGRVLIVSRTGAAQPQWWLPAALGFLGGVVVSGVGFGIWAIGRRRRSPSDSSVEAARLEVFDDPVADSLAESGQASPHQQASPGTETPTANSAVNQPEEPSRGAAPRTAPAAGAGGLAASIAAAPPNELPRRASDEPELPDSYWAPPEA